MKRNCCGANYKWVINQNQIVMWEKVKVVWDLSNVATKRELEHATGIDTCDFAAEKDSIVLKPEAGKLDIN